MTTSCFKAADLSEKQTFQTRKMRRRIFIFGGGCSLGLRPFKYGWDVVCTYLYSILFIKFVVLFWWRWVVFWDTCKGEKTFVQQRWSSYPATCQHCKQIKFYSQPLFCKRIIWPSIDDCMQKIWTHLRRYLRRQSFALNPFDPFVWRK